MAKISPTLEAEETPLEGVLMAALDSTKQQAFTQDVIHTLNTELTEDEISVIQGNKYLKSHEAIRHANEAFGHGNWQTEILDTKVIPLDNNQFQYQVTMRVSARTLDGWVKYEDIGTCQVSRNSDQGHNTGVKGAISDAEKRCLRHFGDFFGLHLYSGEKFNQDEPESQRTTNYAPKTPAASNSAATNNGDLDLHCTVPDCTRSMIEVVLPNGTVISAQRMGGASMKNHGHMLCNLHYREAGGSKGSK